MSKALSSRSEKSVMKATRSRSIQRSMRGRGGPDNASCKFKGVRQRAWGKWVSEIRELNRGKRTWIGTFEDPVSAAMAYDEAAIKVFGVNAILNFPDKLPQVSCPIQATAATRKDTLVHRKEREITEKGITEMQQGEYPPVMAHDKPASRQFGAYAKLDLPESLAGVSSPVHTTTATSNDALINSKGIKLSDERIIDMEQVEYPPGNEISQTAYPYDCQMNNQLINNDDNFVSNKKQYDGGPIINHDEIQGNNVGKLEGSLEERCDDIKENLMVTLPEFDDSSLWEEVMGTTDSEKIKNPEDLEAGDFDDFFKDILGENLGWDNQFREDREMEQVECPPGHEISQSTNSYDCLMNNQLINNDDSFISNKKQYHVGSIINHDEVQGNIKENLMVTLQEFDNSSLWTEVMGTTDSEKIENPEDLEAGDFDDIFRDIMGEDLGLDKIWL